VNDPIPNRIADLLRKRMQPAKAKPDLRPGMLEEVIIGALLDDSTATHLNEIGCRRVDGVDAFRTCGMEQHGRGCVVTLDDGTRYAVTIRRMEDES
jgi:hypothetical protein